MKIATAVARESGGPDGDAGVSTKRTVWLVGRLSARGKASWSCAPRAFISASARLGPLSLASRPYTRQQTELRSCKGSPLDARRDWSASGSQKLGTIGHVPMK